MSNEYYPAAFLGAGGQTPHGRALGPGAATFGCPLHLAAGDSVYAIAASWDERMAAFGTRSGIIHLASWPPGGGPPELKMRQQLIQGASVVSVCLLGAGQLASSDRLSRCLLWPRVDDPGAAVRLETNGAYVISLLGLSDGRLLGLSTDSRLLLWDVVSRQLVGELKALPPAESFPWAKLLYWPACRSVVYPAKGGELVAYELDTGTLRACRAHGDDFYAVLIGDGLLWTVGRSDGLAKAWPDMCSQPCREVQAPRGIMAGAFLDASAAQVLLVNESGEAYVFRLADDALEMVCRVDGGDYRSVAGLPAEVRQAIEQERRRARASELRTQIEVAIKDNGNGLDALHGELIALGFEALSLELRAREAEHKGDELAELGNRHRLAQILLKGPHILTPPLLRYATLLDLTWQQVEAAGVYGRIAALDSSTVAPDRLIAAAEIFQRDDWTIVPDKPLQVLVDAATIVGRPFVGRWIVATSRESVFHDGGLTPEALAARYEQIKMKTAQVSLPRPVPETLWRLTREAASRAGAVVIGDPTGEAPSRLSLVVWVCREGAHVRVALSAAFEVRSPSSGHSPAEHNQEVRMDYERLVVQRHLPEWFGDATHAVDDALRQLLTEARSRRNF